MQKKINILFADDENTFRNIMTNELRRMGYHVTACASGGETLQNLKERDFDVIVLDMNMPVMDGLETLKRIRELEYTTEVIILTGQGSIENAVQAIKQGAYNYLTKPCRLHELDALLQKALEKRQLSRENVHLKRLIDDAKGTPVMIGNSASMHMTYKMVQKIAPADSNVLIQGETGTGKELIAQMIHQHSSRANRPFVVVNCATLQEALLESELFGHVKGAFTGATESKIGLFEIAEYGTLFLDEIGELSISTQAKLLRVIQSGEIRRVGDNRVITVDTRIIAATHKDLSTEVKEGRFREDLYFRLNVISLTLPPLRERQEDIPLFIDHFLKNFCLNKQEKKLLPEVRNLFMKYNWPGNVRELENTIERLVVLSDGDTITTKDLPDTFQGMLSDSNVVGEARVKLAEVERNHIVKVLKKTQWNKTITAEMLGISLKTLYNKLKTYDIEQ
ncbi:MAG: sigma-54 dependent transcriptional regulator [Candidatus Brocadiaceae bacterium]|nr:sigma-54 dependent transcriptional regulator [Candidatus Brocadiaceae bacterium]